MEFINEIVYTPIGYTTDQSIIGVINTRYENSFQNWINQNKTDLENGNILVSEFFVTTPILYITNMTTNYIENLNEITEWL